MTFPEEREYAFLDCGEGLRLERMGGVTVARPAPGAAWRRGLSPEAWEAAALSFTKEGGWKGDAPPDWRVRLGNAELRLRPMAGGQVGVFPEHAAVAESLLFLKDFPPGKVSPALNLFAHTGLATLLLAATGRFAVAHVDGAPASVKRARENAALSGLAEKPVRWLVDDALAFLRRETRRGKKYDLILADPPAFGRAGNAGGPGWKLERDLPELLSLARGLLADGGVLALSCHSEQWDGERLSRCVRENARLETIKTEDLVLIPEARAGKALPCGQLLLAR